MTTANKRPTIAGKRRRRIVAPTIALPVTRRVYAIDILTGQKHAYYVRNFNIVGKD